MLDSTVAMKRVLALILILLLSVSGQAIAQEPFPVVITSPASGQIVQGQVALIGTNAVLGFSSYELAFSYDGDLTNTWFPFHNSELPVLEGELGVWDTTQFSDGDYVLRMRVFLLDGSTIDVTLVDLQVRNYTAVPSETATPSPTVEVVIVAPTAQLATAIPATATVTHPAPTPLTPNPVSLSTTAIYANVGWGALLALLLFLAIGFLLRLRRN